MNTILALKTLATMAFRIYFSSGSFLSESVRPCYMAKLILCSGAWLVLPSYMIYLTGSEILQGLTIAGGGATASSDDTSLVKAE